MASIRVSLPVSYKRLRYPQLRLSSCKYAYRMQILPTPSTAVPLNGQDLDLSSRCKDKSHPSSACYAAISCEMRRRTNAMSFMYIFETYITCSGPRLRRRRRYRRPFRRDSPHVDRAFGPPWRKGRPALCSYWQLWLP